MTARAAGRRTPLGHPYAGSAEALPVDWSATSGDRVHHLAGGRGATGIRLFDLTPHPRFGLKGRGASDWLASQGLAPPERVNTSGPGSSGDLDILRLGQEDIVLLSRPGRPAATLEAVRQAWSDETRKPKGFDSWREEVWAWFHVCGEELAGLMAKTCPVDLRPDKLTVRGIAQTRVAQMDCVVVRTDRAGEPGFDLFFDIASSAFMLSSLRELGAA